MRLCSECIRFENAYLADTLRQGELKMKKIAMTMLAVLGLALAGSVYACDSSHPHQGKSSTSAPATPAK